LEIIQISSKFLSKTKRGWIGNSLKIRASLTKASRKWVGNATKFVQIYQNPKEIGLEILLISSNFLSKTKRGWVENSLKSVQV